MATLTAQSEIVVGQDMNFVAAAGGGDKVPVGSKLYVRNGSGVSITVTVTVPGNTKYGVANPAFTKAVAAGATTQFGPFPADLGAVSDQLVGIAYSAVTTVTVACMSS